MHKKAVYAGSFDPVTMGHLWIIEQAASMFDKVVVAIGENIEKHYTFSLAVRMELLKRVTSKFNNIEITQFNNEFLIHYAQRIDAQFIIRGIRNATDYEYEKSMRYINSDICENINTIFLIPPRNVAEISSSLVKGLVGSHGWEEVVKKYVPEPVVLTMLEWEQNNAGQ
jgi:pantetheine-phosphate adenylyltransferase